MWNGAYIDDLHVASVDAEWRAFFQSLKDDAGDVARSARAVMEEGGLAGPCAPNCRLAGRRLERVEKGIGEKIKAKAQAKGVEVSAADVQQAMRDSVCASTPIRAYRAAATCTPISIRSASSGGSTPRTGALASAQLRFYRGRLQRIDHVLGLEFAKLREIVAICQCTYCQTLGVEFPRTSRSGAEGLVQERIEGPDKDMPNFTREGKRAILNKWSKPKGSSGSAT